MNTKSFNTKSFSLQLYELLRSHKRSGLAQVELLVSAALVGVLFGILATLSYQLNKVYRDARNYQTAIHELANQMESITSLSESEAQAAMNKLQPSAQASTQLQNLSLQGDLIQDTNGTRVKLSIQWERMGPAPPLVLIGWLKGNTMQNSTNASVAPPPSPALLGRTNL